MKINTHVQQYIHQIIALFLVGFITTTASGDPLPAKKKNPFPVQYVSVEDQKININTITLAPVYDNVNKIYSEPIQKLLIELLQSDKVWGYAPFPDINQKIFVETYETNSSDVLNVLNKTAAQGLLTALVTKGPNGLTAKLRLYTADQGLILLEETFQDSKVFEIPKLRDEFVKLYQNLKNKLPYRGSVLSRKGLDVTINAGEKNGLRVGQELSLAQIIKINRHPKLKYLVSTEKEIIGKIQIKKVEPYLSFAQIIFEKESGVVNVGAKLVPTDYVAYPLPIINANGEVIDDKMGTPLQTPDANSPNGEWAPKEPPQYGKVILQGGVGQFVESTRLRSGTSIEASQSLAPTFFMGGEFWFTPNWFVDFNLMQSFFRTENGLAGSNPSTLGYTHSRYSGAVGYYFLLKDDFWGPKVSTQFGFVSYKTDVNDTTPTAFTSTSNGGMMLKVTGSFPLEPDFPIELGAAFNYFISPVYSESPVTSGSASSRINSFGIYLSYQSTPSLRYRFDLTFDQTQADFSGTGSRTNPARSNTLRLNTQLLGIEYLF